MSGDSDKVDHDGSYRTLFEQPAIVQQFLEGFAPAEVVETLRFDLMRPMRTTFLAQNLARRYTDCLWRIPTHGGGALFLCVLIEFQSKVETFMAVRVATYVCLLYEHLINTQRKALGQTLPPVLPVVLYNGTEPWEARTEVAQFIPVISGSALERLQLQMGYLLIDIARLTERDKPQPPNLVSTIFDLEQVSNHARPQGLVHLFDQLLALTEQHPARVALREAFVIFFSGVLSHRGALLDGQTLNNLTGVRTMFDGLETYVERATARAVEERLDRIRAEIREKERKEGREEGRREGVLRVALNLLGARFGAEKDDWRARLAQLDEAQLNAFILRVVDASSEEELEAGG